MGPMGPRAEEGARVVLTATAAACHDSAVLRTHHRLATLDPPVPHSMHVIGCHETILHLEATPVHKDGDIRYRDSVNNRVSRTHCTSLKREAQFGVLKSVVLTVARCSTAFRAAVMVDSQMRVT